MQLIRFIHTCCLAALLTATTVSAQTSDIVVGDISMPNFKWGKQPLTIDVTNQSDYLRFLAVTIEINFQGTYLNPTRLQRRHVMVEPMSTRVLKTVIDIPGNYGTANINYTIYDVIDTLDALLPSQKILSKGSMVRYDLSSAIVPYVQHRITLPPMVENNISFDTESSHLLTILASEGKSVSEIAYLLDCDSAFVKTTLDSMARLAYFKRTANGGAVPVFPVIRFAAAEEGRFLADSVAEQLAAVYRKNLEHHRPLLDSMIAAGSLPADSLDFLSGGSLLFHRYPFITAMHLWGSLGQKFVTDATPMTVFASTDPCNAYTIPYMYLVEGGAVANGHQYFRLEYDANRYSIDFADSLPAVECPDKLALSRSLGGETAWQYGSKNKPEAYIFSPGLCSPLLRLLDTGTEAILKTAREKLDAIAKKHQINNANFGMRYWMWNLIATRTTERLLNEKLMTKADRGFYRMVTK